MDMNIIFLSGEHEGKKGVQRTDESHSVIGIFLDDGTEVTDGCSYVSEWQDAENKRIAAEAKPEVVSQREAIKAENELLREQIFDTELVAENVRLKAFLASIKSE